MKQFLLLSLTLSILLSGLGLTPAAALPEEGLKRAAAAEQKLRAGDASGAIADFQSLDKEMPGHAPVSLRLAEIFDLETREGEALFYYRRYARIAGTRAREEALSRLATLELSPEAQAEAAEVAKRLGETTEPSRPAETRSVETLEKVTASGETQPLTKEEMQRVLEEAKAEAKRQGIELPPDSEFRVPDPPAEKLETRPVIPGSVLPLPGARAAQPNRTPIVIPGTEAVPPSTAPPIDLTAAAFPPRTAAPVAPAEPAATPAATPPPPVAATPAPTPMARMRVEVAQPAPAAPGEPTALDRATLPGMPPPGSVAAGALAVVESNPNLIPPGVANPGLEVGLTDPAKAFTVTKADGDKAVVRLVNKAPSALMTFSATPEAGGDPVNAIVSTDESRTLELAPGTYRIRAAASTSEYPPVSLWSVNDDMMLRAGTQYLKLLPAEPDSVIR